MLLKILFFLLQTLITLEPKVPHRSDASQNDHEQGLSTCPLMCLMRIGKYRRMANPNHDDCTQMMMITIMMTASYMEDDVDNVPPHRTCIDYIRYSKFCHGCDVKPHLSSLSASPPSAL